MEKVIPTDLTTLKTALEEAFACPSGRPVNGLHVNLCQNDCDPALWRMIHTSNDLHSVRIEWVVGDGPVRTLGALAGDAVAILKYDLERGRTKKASAVISLDLSDPATAALKLQNDRLTLYISATKWVKTHYDVSVFQPFWYVIRSGGKLCLGVPANDPSVKPNWIVAGYFKDDGEYVCLHRPDCRPIVTRSVSADGTDSPSVAFRPRDDRPTAPKRPS